MNIKKNVLYILGAGFTAPLEIPTMANFMFKARDMFSLDPSTYGYFKDVFKQIDALHKAKTYIECDLLNIEDILSILEMRNFVLGEQEEVETFRSFLADVIKHHTPEPPVFPHPLDWELETWIRRIFGNIQYLPPYGFFLANLLNLEAIKKTYTPKHDPPRFMQSEQEPDANYGIITLNYDLVFENYLDYLAVTNNVLRPDIRRITTYNGEQDVYDNNSACVIAKIHGSIEDPVSIIPPTWNKITMGDRVGVWRLAHELIRKANFIRVLGYSLPESDTYFKYLLTSGIIESENLKGIDVVCLDDTDQLEKRYKKVITFRQLNYANGDITEYLKPLSEKLIETADAEKNRRVRFNSLERLHENFMRQSR